MSALPASDAPPIVVNGDVPVTLRTRPPRQMHGISEAGPALLALEAGQQYRFTFDMNSCIGCHSCEVACAEQNGLPVDVAWRRVGEIEGGAFPDTKRFNLSLACNHCLEPTCLEGCPTGAYEKLSNGVVKHNADDCIGCQYCTWNCPYSVPVYNSTRKIVTKCDMCLPRLESGATSACVEACPTHAIGIEIVDIESWRADHRAGDAPNLPSADITLSTTRIVLPIDMPLETFAASDYDVSPEEPHWPLIAVTLLSQLAVGVTGAVALIGSDRGASIVAFLAAAIALPTSLFHLGRPALAWKALRGLRRSWLSREVLAFGLFATAAMGSALLPNLATTLFAFAIGIAAVYASGRLYVVVGRPAWNTPYTLWHFGMSGFVTGPPLVMIVTGVRLGLQWLTVGAIVAQLVVLSANTLRLRRRVEREWHGSARLMTQWFRPLFVTRVVAALIGALLVLTGASIAAFTAVALAECAGRYLFYVTVVPMNMPRSFARSRQS